VPLGPGCSKAAKQLGARPPRQVFCSSNSIHTSGRNRLQRLDQTRQFRSPCRLNEASRHRCHAQFLTVADVIGKGRVAHRTKAACASEGWCKRGRASIKAANAAAARRPCGPHPRWLEHMPRMLSCSWRDRTGASGNLGRGSAAWPGGLQPGQAAPMLAIRHVHRT